MLKTLKYTSDFFMKELKENMKNYMIHTTTQKKLLFMYYCYKVKH